MAVLRVTDRTQEIVNAEIEERNAKPGAPRFTQESLTAEIIEQWGKQHGRLCPQCGADWDKKHNRCKANCDRFEKE